MKLFTNNFISMKTKATNTRHKHARTPKMIKKYRDFKHHVSFSDLLIMAEEEKKK